MAMKMSKILGCSVKECSYNKNGECHTIAITVGDGSHAACDTFYRSQHKGGAPDMHGCVGACRAEDCSFNSLLECTAPGIDVGPHAGHADCRTFSSR